jgi:hypothetical protein
MAVTIHNVSDPLLVHLKSITVTLSHFGALGGLPLVASACRRDCSVALRKWRSLEHNIS